MNTPVDGCKCNKHPLLNRHTTQRRARMKPEMGRDENTPVWVQHIAFKVKDRAELIAFKDHLETSGVEVLGVTDHSIFHSIYFFDPNGHRIELACPDPKEDAMLARLNTVKWDMLEEWSRTKKAPKHAEWMHQKELSDI
ncbi:VOC family protein [Thalassobius sp. S69A]|uniref:VOC family protein n=1 Tax=unclassified Thalassovita TaxID=2619711 RepID=UPI003C7D87D7